MSHNVIFQKNHTVETNSRFGKFTLHRWNAKMPTEELEKIKEFGKEIYRSAGYSDYETTNLDQWSEWFYVTHEGVLQAATRLVLKTESNLLPLEIAKRHPSGDQYRINKTGFHQIADWNSVTFYQTILGVFGFKIAAKAVAKYCLENQINLVYGMINPIWTGLHRVYLEKGAIASKEFSDPVYFPGCELNGTTAHFRLIEFGENALQNIASNL
ncbi:LBL_2463 family protein [Leptospira kmetyi]|uniref:LBL_2463 family protein n=1 Tax=Leptospira kmetyi TaxID=408139 RepID=UPI001A9C967A